MYLFISVAVYHNLRYDIRFVLENGFIQITYTVMPVIRYGMSCDVLNDIEYNRTRYRYDFTCTYELHIIL